MRIVFLDCLPKTKKGIDWKNSVGYKVKFIYDGIEGDLEIIEFDSSNHHVILLYQNNRHEIRSASLLHCQIAHIVGTINSGWVFEIGEVINTNKRNLKILEQTKVPVGRNNWMLKGYKYKCLDCGDIRIKTEDEVKKNGCGVCSGLTVLIGHNDIYTTNPEFGNLIWDKEDGFKYSVTSCKKIDFKCPKCGIKINNKIIDNIFRRGLSCPRCSDGISYPEKFLFSVLTQLNRDFDCQVSFEWSENKRYDFYDLKLKYIFEAHGMQHYRESEFPKTLEEEMINDKIKKELALNNDIKNYIVIDCRFSELEWIKKSILNSEMNGIFELSNIDWLQCHQYACSSLVKVACDLWNSGINNTLEISKVIKVNRTNVSKYLQKGALIGWCNYNVETVKKLGRIKAGSIAAEKQKIPVIQLTKKGIFIKEYESIKDAHEYTNINRITISNVCKGKQKTSGGFRWMFKEEYEKILG